MNNLGIFIQLIVREPEKHLNGRASVIDSIVLSSREQGTLTNKVMVKITEMTAAIGSKIRRKGPKGPNEGKIPS